jgi:hypothetical protein
MRSAPVTCNNTRCRWHQVGPKLCTSRASKCAGPGTWRCATIIIQPGTPLGASMARTCHSSFSKMGSPPLVASLLHIPQLASKEAWRMAAA